VGFVTRAWFRIGRDTDDDNTRNPPTLFRCRKQILIKIIVKKKKKITASTMMPCNIRDDDIVNLVKSCTYSYIYIYMLCRFCRFRSNTTAAQLLVIAIILYNNTHIEYFNMCDGMSVVVTETIVAVFFARQSVIRIYIFFSSTRFIF